MWFMLPYYDSVDELCMKDPRFLLYFHPDWSTRLRMTLHNFLQHVFNSVPVPRLLAFNIPHLQNKFLRGNVALKNDHLENLEQKYTKLQHVHDNLMHDNRILRTENDARGHRIAQLTRELDHMREMFQGFQRRKGDGQQLVVHSEGTTDKTRTKLEITETGGTETTTGTEQESRHSHLKKRTMIDSDVISNSKKTLGKVITTALPSCPLKGHTQGTSVLCLRFDPQGEFLASSGADATLRIWKVTTTPPSQSMKTSATKKNQMESSSSKVILNQDDETDCSYDFFLVNTIYCKGPVLSIDWVQNYSSSLGSQKKNIRSGEVESGILFGTSHGGLKLWDVYEQRMVKEVYIQDINFYKNNNDYGEGTTMNRQSTAMYRDHKNNIHKSYQDDNTTKTQNANNSSVDGGMASSGKSQNRNRNNRGYFEEERKEIYQCAIQSIHVAPSKKKKVLSGGGSCSTPIIFVTCISVFNLRTEEHEMPHIHVWSLGSFRPFCKLSMTLQSPSQAAPSQQKRHRSPKQNNQSQQNNNQSQKPYLQLSAAMAFNHNGSLLLIGGLDDTICRMFDTMSCSRQLLHFVNTDTGTSIGSSVPSISSSSTLMSSQSTQQQQQESTNVSLAPNILSMKDYLLYPSSSALPSSSMDDHNIVHNNHKKQNSSNPTNLLMLQPIMGWQCCTMSENERIISVRYLPDETSAITVSSFGSIVQWSLHSTPPGKLLNYYEGSPQSDSETPIRSFTSTTIGLPGRMKSGIAVDTRFMENLRSNIEKENSILFTTGWLSSTSLTGSNAFPTSLSVWKIGHERSLGKIWIPSLQNIQDEESNFAGLPGHGKMEQPKVGSKEVEEISSSVIADHYGEFAFEEDEGTSSVQDLTKVEESSTKNNDAINVSNAMKKGKLGIHDDHHESAMALCLDVLDEGSANSVIAVGTADGKINIVKLTTSR
eukprot:g3500.t1